MLVIVLISLLIGAALTNGLFAVGVLKTADATRADAAETANAQLWATIAVDHPSAEPGTATATYPPTCYTWDDYSASWRQIVCSPATATNTATATVLVPRTPTYTTTATATATVLVPRTPTYTTTASLTPSEPTAAGTMFLLPTATTPAPLEFFKILIYDQDQPTRGTDNSAQPKITIAVSGGVGPFTVIIGDFEFGLVDFEGELIDQGVTYRTLMVNPKTTCRGLWPLTLSIYDNATGQQLVVENLSVTINCQ